MFRLRSTGSVVGFAVVAILASPLAASDLAHDPNVRAALNRISAQSMRGHVSFLASDLLEGRATPSAGLDIAAEYVAAQFRRAGLESAGDNGFFQTAKFVQFEPDRQGAVVEVESAGKRIPANLETIGIQTTAPVDLNSVAVLKFSADDAQKVEGLRHDDVKDKIVAFYLTRDGLQTGYRTYTSLRRLRPAALIVAGPGVPRQQRAKLVAADQRDAEPIVISVRDGEIVDAIEHATPEMKATIKLPAPKERTVPLKNVVGVLRGSDPVLKDTYLMVTAHYDHMGVKAEGDGDRIYNGANDDASGTSSVIEIASALASMDPRPKRSIVFIALFGEELGLLGSQYYGRHPIFPLTKTVGDINLEHMGRTDALDGDKMDSASFTGFDYTNLPQVFKAAGEQLGVNVYKDDKRSDPYFARSDNQALADLGIPAHTIGVAFEFPDYHGVGDEWPKLNYDNMAKVDRMVALGLLMLADSNIPPKWNDTEAKTKRYVEAWNTLHADGTK